MRRDADDALWCSRAQQRSEATKPGSRRVALSREHGWHTMPDEACGLANLGRHGRSIDARGHMQSGNPMPRRDTAITGACRIHWETQHEIRAAPTSMVLANGRT
jgi:hypothetical protein